MNEIEREELFRLMLLGATFSNDGTIEMPDGTWGCRYCSGCGFEDYPSNTKPCRVNGHKDRFIRETCILPMTASSISLKRG